MPSSILTLPVELVYRILDNLNEKAIFLSLRNVCTRLNTIIDTYHRYQVNFSILSKGSFSSFLKHSFKKNHILQLPSLLNSVLDRIRETFYIAAESPEELAEDKVL